MLETIHRPTRPKLYVIKNPRRLPPPHLSTGDRVILFDGECVLCRRMIQCLIRIDSRQRIRLATVQSPPGEALLRWAGLPVDDFNTIAYIAQGEGFGAFGSLLAGDDPAGLAVAGAGGDARPAARAARQAL
ncbi:thiol-disulfide oxidoreductase DCC family protein [Sodalis praecaptivus]|uniref:thiol-disulfide oxidoreductase DCC family protein n=1 Tax=Sodalis praecaptivus TaxID=1239307 RepID=UPI0027FC9C91|nr:DCC1-like thiol-disulfide oxidoreductase family protein [Sodalis praecaptivus]CAJ0998157.1 hypothetical protein NVIRENTERO_03196 [Sodalis praecaptivus]